MNTPPNDFSRGWNTQERPALAPGEIPAGDDNKLRLSSIICVASSYFFVDGLVQIRGGGNFTLCLFDCFPYARIKLKTTSDGGGARRKRPQQCARLFTVIHDSLSSRRERRQPRL